MDDLTQIRDAQPDEVIRQVLDRSGYRRMLLDSTDTEDQERLANIEELITAAKQFAAEDPTRTIGDFLENITLASDVDGWDEQQDCVSVMTHARGQGAGVSRGLHGGDGAGPVAARAQPGPRARKSRRSGGWRSSA